MLAKKPILILANDPKGILDEQSGRNIIELMVYLGIMEKGRRGKSR